jgi:hypothetical protein
MNTLQLAILAFLSCFTGPMDLSIPGHCVETETVTGSVVDSTGMGRCVSWDQRARWICPARPECLYYDTDRDGDVDLKDWAVWTNHWSVYPDRQSLLDRVELLEEKVEEQEHVIYWLLNR